MRHPITPHSFGVDAADYDVLSNRQEGSGDAPRLLSEFREDWDKWRESRREFYSERNKDFMKGPISVEERIGYLEQEVDELIFAIARLTLAFEANGKDMP